MKNNSSINIKDLKRVLNHVINTNKKLQLQGLSPIAINVVGQAGLGKTSTIKQVAHEYGFSKDNIVYLNLSTLQEVGDLIGTPVTEYKMVKKVTDPEGKNTIKKDLWVKETALTSYVNSGWVITSESRMSYSIPEWIAGKKGPGMLIIDDYTRASQRFTQAVMELILNQNYGSWSLPLGWTIVLSSNPDDGTYNVSDTDPAQLSRHLNVNLGWDAEVWAEWATKNNIDSRCINFLLMNKEIIKPETPEINARSITLFFNAISTIEDFRSELDLITLLGEGSLGTELTSMFVSFIHHKLDKLISVERILDTNIPYDTISKELVDLIGEKEHYRGDIAYVIATRLLNHLEFSVKSEDVDQTLLARLEEILVSNNFGSDLKFVIGTKLTNMNGKYNALVASEAVIDNILDY